MGEPPQERLIRKLELERFLSQIEPNHFPQVNLEQYTISEAVAARMLYLAAYSNGDIIGKRVLDLGCGTGRLALAASFLGAEYVLGVDIGKTAIVTARENSENAGLTVNVEWIVGDISAVIGNFDTVLQNPPFGVQKRAADRKFLEKALDVGNVVYSLHNHPQRDRQLIKRLKANPARLWQVVPSPFLEKFIENHQATVKAVYAMLMTIPHMFDFHTKIKHDLVVDLYIIKKND